MVNWNNIPGVPQLINYFLKLVNYIKEYFLVNLNQYYDIDKIICGLLLLK